MGHCKVPECSSQWCQSGPTAIRLLKRLDKVMTDIPTKCYNSRDDILLNARLEMCIRRRTSKPSNQICPNIASKVAKFNRQSTEGNLRHRAVPPKSFASYLKSVESSPPLIKLGKETSCTWGDCWGKLTWTTGVHGGKMILGGGGLSASYQWVSAMQLFPHWRNKTQKLKIQKPNPNNDMNESSKSWVFFPPCWSPKHPWRWVREHFVPSYIPSCEQTQR